MHYPFNSLFFKQVNFSDPSFNHLFVKLLLIQLQFSGFEEIKANIEDLICIQQ